MKTVRKPALDFNKLSLDDRVPLVNDIRDGTAEEANARSEALPLSGEQRTELRRRVSEADAQSQYPVPWDEVRKELYKRGG